MTLRKRHLAHAASDGAIFAVATACTYLAQSYERPITAVLVYLTSVVLIAARSGRKRGIIAALGASVFYSFFLSKPVYRMDAASVDEIVPLIAFNLSAIGTGALIGRLKDSANRARAARARSDFLLNISDRLQQAIRVDDVEKSVSGLLPAQGLASLRIFLEAGGTYVHPETGEGGIVRASLLVPGMTDFGAEVSVKVLELGGSQGSLGVVRFGLIPNQRARREPDLAQIAGLLTLAVERCLLLERISEARAAQRTEELKDAILSSVSHDLRTPLTAIEAAASGLRSAGAMLSDTERANLLEAILAQCGRLNRYTSNLLDMGRIQSGISSSQLTRVDLGEILGAALGHARIDFPDQRIARQLTAEPVIVNANAVMLEQAIFNLIENAVKHAGSAGPVTIRLTCADEAGILEIEDDGPGIAENERARVFERFYQSPVRNGAGGSGLGLYIASGFVEAFGGTLETTTARGSQKGTRMVIRLPQASADHPD